jgi:lysylphosphatidylglycerol synthetase-like protein (DUF2156 family)
MPRVSAAFFGFAIASLLIGMLAGIYMGGREDMTLMPAHAHLNLLGWVTMALYGTFYALTRETHAPKLAWTNFWISALSVLILLPVLSLFLLSGNDLKYVPAMLAGEALAVLGAIVFAIAVARELFRRRD